MSRVIYKIDENGGAWDFVELDPQEAETYVLPAKTGNVETDLYETVGPLGGEPMFLRYIYQNFTIITQRLC